MPHDYRKAYRRGMEILNEAKWSCDSKGMFRPPSLAKGSPVRVECEQLATELHVPVLSVGEEVLLAARIHHFIATCGIDAEQYFLSGDCPIAPKKIALLSRRMPPFIRAKMKSLLAGSVNVVSNPDHAFDTDGWPELKRRLPKFRTTMEHYAAQCVGTPMQAQLDDAEIERLQTKLRSIRHECDLIEKKLRSTQAKVKGSSRPAPHKSSSKPAVNWPQAHGRIAQVYGVLQKTHRDLHSKFWKPEWVPTENELKGVMANVEAIALAATKIQSWLQ